MESVNILINIILEDLMIHLGKEHRMKFILKLLNMD